MNKFKTFGQFVNESKQDNIVNAILDTLEPTIVEMLSATEKWFVEKFKQEFTKYDRELARINLTYDVVKSIEMYTSPTDSLSRRQPLSRTVLFHPHVRLHLGHHSPVGSPILTDRRRLHPVHPQVLRCDYRTLEPLVKLILNPETPS